MNADRFARRRVLVVLAHPDDEALACGGTLAWCASEGAAVWLVCATRGEAGRCALPDFAEPLADLRAGELGAAAQRLGISRVRSLNYPDGRLREVDSVAAAAAVQSTIESFRPDVVITFGPDGLYWHPDHIAVHDWTLAAVERLATARPVLLRASMPAGAMRRLVDVASATAGRQLSLWGIDPDAFGAAAQPADLFVDVRRYAHTKLAALRCHATQIGADNPLHWIAVNDFASILGVEQFDCPLDQTLPAPFAKGPASKPIEDGHLGRKTNWSEKEPCLIMRAGQFLLPHR